MPLSRLEIEQTAPDRWVAEVEVGGISNYRITVRGNTFAQIIAECERAYYEKRPDEMPVPVEVLGETFPTVISRSISADTGGYIPGLVRPKRVLSEEHKRAMAEGRARARWQKSQRDQPYSNEVDEGPDAA
jgi:hypothetical protein